MQLVVHVMYDSDLGRQHSFVTDKMTKEENISAYFHDLFQKVEGAFLNLSVNISLTIASVFQNNNLSVRLKASTRKVLLDRQKTLEKVKDYGQPKTGKNMEIYYYFVSHPLVDSPSERYSSDAATGAFGTSFTFCTRLKEKADLFSQREKQEHNKPYNDVNQWNVLHQRIKCSCSEAFVYEQKFLLESSNSNGLYTWRQTDSFFCIP
nr:uncharacterized protein LOC129380718 isoform X2 [Dermacentor andersoni]